MLALQHPLVKPFPTWELLLVNPSLRGPARGEAQHSDMDLLESITNSYFKGRLPLVLVSHIVLACLETASKQKSRPLKTGRVWELYWYLPV